MAHAHGNVDDRGDYNSHVEVKTEVGKLNLQLGTHTKKTYRKPSEQLFSK